MPKVGFEPTRTKVHGALNAARLPVPPLRLRPLIVRYVTAVGEEMGRWLVNRGDGTARYE